MTSDREKLEAFYIPTDREKFDALVRITIEQLIEDVEKKP